MVERGFIFLQSCPGLLFLRLQDRELLPGRDRVGLRRGEGGLSLQQIGCILLRLLDRDRTRLGEMLVSLVLLLREGQGCLCFRGLFVGLIDTGLLRAKLGADVGNGCIGLTDPCLGLIVPAA